MKCSPKSVITFLGSSTNSLANLVKHDWFHSHVLLDFSLTVKAAILIFILGCGSAISSAKEGKSGSIYINKLFEPRKRACIS